MKSSFIPSLLRALSVNHSNAAILWLRMLAGSMMLSHGIAKISNYSQFSQNFADPLHIGGTLSFTLIMLAESVGSALVILGLLTRLAAAALVFGMLVAAFIIHVPFHFSGSELPLLYCVVFIVLVLGGGGRFSLDYLFWGRNTDKV